MPRSTLLPWPRLAWLWSALVLSSAPPACGRGAGAGEASSAEADPSGTQSRGPDGRAALCERAGDDAVRDVFCAAAPPAIHGLADLQERLHLQIVPPEPSNKVSPFGYYPSNDTHVFVALLAHSTALSGALVSPINPRIVVMTDGTFMTFTRGVQQVELVSEDRGNQRFNFYLLRFEQACNTSDLGCSASDRYSARIESNWTSLSLQDAEDLKNTPSDCRQCHQRGLDRPVLLMRELNGPWTHFLSRLDDPPFPYPEPTGADLMRDFLAAHGDEPFGGYPSHVLQTAHAFTLRNYVDTEQPLLFDALTILHERWPQLPSGYASEPMRSASWDDAYAAFKRGEQLALPYFAPRVSDADKQAQLTAAYAASLEPAHAGDELPDLADIFPDDPQTRAQIGLQVEPGATGAQALVQACGSCHNDVLDQSISRARFNIAIGRLDARELGRAIDRLRADAQAPGRMPPREARQLDEGTRARLIEYLGMPSHSQADREFLEQAAQRGMLGRSPQ